MGKLKEIYDRVEFNNEMRSSLIDGNIINYTEKVLKDNGVPEECICRESDTLIVKDINKEELMNVYMKGVRYAPLDIKKKDIGFMIKRR